MTLGIYNTIQYILFSIKLIIMFIAYTNNLHINVVNNKNNFLGKHLVYTIDHPKLI